MNMKPPLRHLFSAAAVLLLLAAAALLYHRAGGRYPAFENHVYVWQTAWNEPVANAARQVAPAMDSFMFLAGAFTLNGGELACRRSIIDWQTVKTTAKPVTAVIRADVGFAAKLQSDQLETTARALVDDTNRVLNDAGQNGVVVTGFQLDYDCPTSKLPDYARLLNAIHSLVPEMELSITALPTWLASPDFKRLLPPLDYYVLQVHALEKPTTASNPPVLCDSAKVAAWAKTAARLRKPFYIALPTYGYRLAFDSHGSFAAVGAEGSQPSVPPGGQLLELIADPFQLAPVVKNLHTRPPRFCRGITWFRMPVETDDLNWSWPTLQSVMAGDPPLTAFAAEVRKPREDLCEIWMRNTGDFRPSRPLRVVVKADPAALRAHDCIGGYSAHFEDAALVLTGPAPRINQDLMAAWCLMQPGSSLTIGNVEVTQ